MCNVQIALLFAKLMVAIIVNYALIISCGYVEVPKNIDTKFKRVKKTELPWKLLIKTSPTQERSIEYMVTSGINAVLNCYIYPKSHRLKQDEYLMQCNNIGNNHSLLFAAGFLWKQTTGKDKERSNEAVGREDLSEEDPVGAHFASTRLIHRLCRTSHPGKMSYRLH